MRLLCLAVLAAAVLLTACEKPPPKPPQPIVALSQLMA
ncbi:MAG: hypothetical protein K0R43_4211 [Pseudoduganella sp.]|jgi:hypothetical protein|nr:hypothetical protein [Pseudoduganella sp.]